MCREIIFQYEIDYRIQVPISQTIFFRKMDVYAIYFLTNTVYITRYRLQHLNCRAWTFVRLMKGHNTTTLKWTMCRFQWLPNRENVSVDMLRVTSKLITFLMFHTGLFVRDTYLCWIWIPLTALSCLVLRSLFFTSNPSPAETRIFRTNFVNTVFSMSWLLVSTRR